MAIVAAALVGPVVASVRVAAVSPPAGRQNLDTSQEVGLEGLLRSLIEGDNPLITEVPDSQPFSPFGNDVVDDTGESTIALSYDFVINLTGFATAYDSTYPNSSDMSTDIVRVGTDSSGAVDAWTLADPYQWTLEDNQIPVFGQETYSSTGGILVELGLDLSSSATQPALGTDVVVAQPMNPDTTPLTGPTTVWGAAIASSYGSNISCAPYIYEFGRGFLTVAGTAWVAGSHWPKDLFTGISNSLVIRCDPVWYVGASVNSGSSFQLSTTATNALVAPSGYIAFTPSREFADSTGYRLFAFRTPASGGFQADNTFATTYPAFPELMDPHSPIVVSDPYPGADHGPFPIHLGFTAQTDTCGGDWTALFEVYAWNTPTPNSFDLGLYQFASGQHSMGTLTLGGAEPHMTTEGSGDAFTEMFDLVGPTGTYVFSPEGAEWPLPCVQRQRGARAPTAPALPQPPVPPATLAGDAARSDARARTRRSQPR